MDKTFVTFDIDWAHDSVLIDSIEIMERAGVKATFFVTHDTPVLQRLRNNNLFELGIHPNFNFLLQGDFRNGATAEEVVDRLLKIVPEAKSVRSHSLTQSSRIMDLFCEKGLTHECNGFIPEQIDMALKPWVHWNGIIRIPHFWEDDISCVSMENSTIESLALRPGLRVFDFHPIHVFLNTENLSRYEVARNLANNPELLLSQRNLECTGVRDNLLALIRGV